MRLAWTSLSLAAAFGVALLAAGLARAGDDPKPAGMPQPQKQLDCPLAKALDGEWSVAHKSPFGDGTGSSKFALGVGGTALIQDYEMPMGPLGKFHGHAVWKVSDDNKTVHGWWFDSHSAEPQHFKGTLSDTGYEVKSQEGTRLTLAKKGEGYEFQLFEGDAEAMFTDTYTKK